MQGDSLQCVIPAQGSGNLRELDRMRECGQLTDVTIVTEDHARFDCHRAVLAASCPYFKAMFLGGLRECHETEVRVHDISGETMQIVLHFVYTGICILSRSTAAGIVKAADLIGLISLRDAALEYLQTRLDVTNCLRIEKLAYEHSLVDVYERVRRFSRINFKEIVFQEQFNQLEADQVMGLLSDDDIDCSREEMVFDAAVRWIRADVETRAHLVGKLLGCVRLPFVRAEYLKLQATVEPLVYGSKECVRQVLEARKYQMTGEFPPDVDSRQRKPRRGTSKEVLMIFGAETVVTGSRHDQFADEVFYYDATRKRWDRVAMAPGTVHCSAFTAASLHCEVYLTGGVEEDKPTGEVRVFYTYLNKWKRAASLITPRYHHACLASHNKLYVLGGTDGTRCLNAVECYCPVQNKWLALAPMPTPVKCPAAASCRGKIHIFGGFTQSYVITHAIQIYEVASGTWTSVTSSLIDYTCAKAACVDDDVIYLLGGSSKVVKKYDVGTGTIEMAPSMKQKRDNCGVAVLDGKVYVSGGVNQSCGGTPLDSVECFCRQTNTWETITAAPVKIYRHSSVTARIPVYQRDAPNKVPVRHCNVKSTVV